MYCERRFYLCKAESRFCAKSCWSSICTNDFWLLLKRQQRILSMTLISFMVSIWDTANSFITQTNIFLKLHWTSQLFSAERICLCNLINACYGLDHTNQTVSFCSALHCWFCGCGCRMAVCLTGMYVFHHLATTKRPGKCKALWIWTIIST